MFQSARLKLTAYYLLIIMLVSILFSVVIYTVINEEYNRLELVQKIRQEREAQLLTPSYEAFRRDRELRGLPTPPMPEFVDPSYITQARIRLQTLLLMVNLAILGLAGFAGYFLAGRTLKPIKTMVEDQNRFITDASHELRTPITSLKTATEVYLRDKKHSLKESDKLHESNLEEINNLHVLSDNLIKLTQYQKNNNHFLIEDLSLSEIIEGATKKVANLAKHKKISILNETTDVRLMGDRQGLCELFVILLENAVKYSSTETKITITSKQLDQSVRVKVIDQGMGIEKEDLPHLFDRFYRADKSRSKSDVVGYGLGLSIAKQIIDKHKASIKVESEVGKGTIFSINLPLKFSKKLV